MQITIDVDIGGTFTDCVAIIGDRVVVSKSPTTRPDPSLGFLNVIDDAASQLGMATEELLTKTSIIRYSTTMATNTICERNGPRIGLLTTAGFEHVLLVGRSRVWGDGLHPAERRHLMYKYEKPQPLVPLELTLGIKERVDCFGHVVVPIDANEVREKVRYLVDHGARAIVVAFLWSFLNPSHERVVRDLCREEFPERFVGGVPVLLSSEVHPKWHEYARTNVTVMTAYLHEEMSRALFALNRGLRQQGYKMPLIIVKNTGGVSKLARTKSLDTAGGGPVAGLLASAYVSNVYGLPRVMASDMGGTSFDYGLVENGECSTFVDYPTIDCWATELSMIDVKSIGAGGGSIAWLNENLGNRLEVGPLSASSQPGPACYGLGGERPTVTDADVILGYVSPDRFLGGKLKLDKGRAQTAMDKIAGPLGMSVEEAARAVRKVVDANMGNKLAAELSAKGKDPREFTLFAFGGGGPAHCAAYGSPLGASKIMVFPYSSVFCAFGGATMDAKHLYEISRHIVLLQPGGGARYLEEFEEFNLAVKSLRDSALRDIVSEGFKAEDISFTLELEGRYGRQLNLLRFPSPRLVMSNQRDVEQIIDAFYRAYVRRYGELSALPEAGISIENLCLAGTIFLDKPQLPSFEMSGEDPSRALTGTRPVFWEDSDRFSPTSIYDIGLLQGGNVIRGPGIVDAITTTIVIPPGTRYTTDRFHTGILEAE